VVTSISHRPDNLGIIQVVHSQFFDRNLPASEGPFPGITITSESERPTIGTEGIIRKRNLYREYPSNAAYQPEGVRELPMERTVRTKGAKDLR